MKSEGWRPLRRQKKPLLTAKQRAARLKFAKQYKNLTTEEWDDFVFFWTNVQNICFSCLVPKMILFGGPQENQVPPAYPVKKKLKMDHSGRNDRLRSHMGFILYYKDRL